MAEIEYERRDVNLRTVLKAGAVLGGISVFGIVATVGVFVLFDRWSDRQERPVPPLAYEPGRLPPEPRLQSTPQVDIEDLRAQQRQRLSAYGWAEAPGGAVHIPIDEAMRLYAERTAGRPVEPVGAPPVPPPPAAAAGASGTATVPAAAPPPASPAARSPRP